jgi:DNA-binding CsgD family transcriptional regulator
VAEGSLAVGRRAYEARAWTAAYAAFRKAGAEGPLEPEDLERAAQAAYLTGLDEDCEAMFERAYQQRLRRDDGEGAALDAFWLSFGLINRGEWARANGWLVRAGEAVAGGPPDCAARGYLLLPDALRALHAGEADDAYRGFSRAREVGERCADADLIALTDFGVGQALMELGRVAEGIARLDLVMVSVTAEEITPMIAGLIYCGVIAACMEVFDAARAKEWTTALTRWCESQPDLVPFRGHCLVHRAQIMSIHGAWADALEELHEAQTRLTQAGHPAAGDALYERAEVHRWRGDFDDAEEAYRGAIQFGRDAQPGLALLRLAQGRLDAAAAGLRRALDESAARLRPRQLAVAVEVALAAGDTAWARSAVDELTELTRDCDLPLITAIRAQAEGAVLLAEGDARAALPAARRAWSLWYGLDAPYEAARARVVVGGACRALGDEDAARMELDAARLAFTELAALPDVARVDALMEPVARPAGHGLTAREVEVLRLVATGRTNKAVAGELFLSEKTVARHLSNIFVKLGVPTRAAATAYAYEHGLV